MKAFRVLLPVMLLLGLRSSPVLAESVVEEWRGGGFSFPAHIAVNPADGSCWVADSGNGAVVRLAQDGTELVRVDGFSDIGIESDSAISVDPTDGSCWIADTGNDRVVHLAADGAELLSAALPRPAAISLNSVDGSCWAVDAEAHEVVHLDEDGNELLRVDGFGQPMCISVDPTDGSCWVGEWVGGHVVHLAEDGTELARVSGFNNVVSVSVNPTDGSCWVADMGADWVMEYPEGVVHLADDGTELWRGGNAVGNPSSVSVNPADGSCWVAGESQVGLLHLAADGTELWRSETPSAGAHVSVNPTDGSCWVADSYEGAVARLVICSPFADVDCGFWARDQIVACVDGGVVAGYPDGLYHPEIAVTRDQMAVYISRALAGGDENVPDFTGTPTFPDVDDTHWALDYVEYAAAQNVVAGYDDGTYHPEYPVTRDQMAVYVARSICDPTGEEGLAGYVPADPRNFPDAGSEFWAYTHIEYCVENGVVAGYLDGLYHPEIVVTRDQMAVYVARAFGLTS